MVGHGKGGVNTNMLKRDVGEEKVQLPCVVSVWLDVCREDLLG